MNPILLFFDSWREVFAAVGYLLVTYLAFASVSVAAGAISLLGRFLRRQRALRRAGW